MNHFPKRRKAKKTKKGPQIRCAGHLQWVRGHECSIIGQHKCTGGIEAAHVRRGTDGGMSVKPSDIWSLPLCFDGHDEQHTIGEASFEKKYGIKMKAIAERLAATSPHRIKWQESYTMNKVVQLNAYRKFEIDPRKKRSR